MVLRQVQFQLVEFSWVMHPKVEIFFSQWATLIGTSQKKVWNFKHPLNRSFHFQIKEGGVTELIFFPCSQCVPMRFPKLFAQDVPNSTSELFYAACPKSNSRRWIIGEHICFYFVTGVQKGASIGELPMFPKTLVMCQSMWLLWKSKKKNAIAPMNFGWNFGPF
jgi:hypothetical protein